MKLWQVAIAGVILSTLLIQQCSVNGQNCFIDNFNNSKEFWKNCNNAANAKSLILNVTKLENIPYDVINHTQSIESVDVSNTSLQYMNHSLNLCQWLKLTCIDADDNNITELEDNVLSDCHQLSILGLARNNINRIYDQAFSGLNSLKQLDLSNNQLTSISAETFEPLSNLHELHLNNNRIRTINFDMFTKNVNLKVLDLSYNAISQIQEHAFEKLKDLTTFSIQCNADLKSLDLNGMDKLNTLNVNNASLSQLDIPKSIVNVNADNNKIMYVSVGANSMLQMLSLKNNSLQNLSNLSLAQQLHELDISNNNISSIDFTPLMTTNVEKIVMLENPIHTINVTALVMLPKLKMIEITTKGIDNKTLVELMVKTKVKGITLSDPNRTTETVEIVTLPPVTPVAKPNDTTTLRPSSVGTTTASPTPTATTAPPPSPTSNSTDGQIKDLLKRIQNIESSLANQTNRNAEQKESAMKHDEIEESLSHVRFMVNFMVVAIFIFVAVKVVLYLRDNQWSVPISTIFSRTPHARVNGRRNPFNDSMDPIIEEVL